MENELSGLSLEDKEEEILQAQKESDSAAAVFEFCLVGCFLTASVIHFPAMRSTMTNLWHPVRGVQISDLEEKRFLFRFFHKMDMDQVLRWAPWAFNNHLLMIHRLEYGDDSMNVPLIYEIFWVQGHDIPPGFFY
ncbi:hypothetical protein Gohar_008086 [Gossypium harknessii]|uniref:DUF4283 domain-containing protein n=1 Tax=Gossypium harknessii TaxID=34285 RepID=A0A7J9GII3_9ROSI|nr:hypothetical protein [Gossypium harknessii]